MNGRTFRTRARLTQDFKRVDAGVVSIVPTELERVATNQLDIKRLKIIRDLNQCYVSVALRRKQRMDIPPFIPDDGALGTRTHLSEIGIWIPTHMSIFPFYLKDVIMFFEKFRTFCGVLHPVKTQGNIRS